MWMPSRFTKMFGAPAYIAPALLVATIGSDSFALSFKKDVEDALKVIREAARVEAEEEDGELKVANSKRLVECSNALRDETAPYAVLLFLVIGSKVLPLLWTIFDSDDTGGGASGDRRGREPKSLLDIVEATREVLRRLRDVLRPESVALRLLHAFKPEGVPNAEFYDDVRSAISCVITESPCGLVG